MQLFRFLPHMDPLDLLHFDQTTPTRRAVGELDIQRKIIKHPVGEIEKSFSQKPERIRQDHFT